LDNEFHLDNYIEKIKLQPCKNNVIWRRNLRRAYVAQACFSLFLFAFSFCCSDSPLHVFNFSPFESSFLIPLVRILENSRRRTRMRSFLGQPLRPQDPSREKDRAPTKETHQTTSPRVRKKDLGGTKTKGTPSIRWWSSSHLREKSLSPLTFKRAFSNNCYRTLAIRGESRRCGNLEKCHRINEWIGIEPLWSRFLIDTDS